MHHMLTMLFVLLFLAGCGESTKNDDDTMDTQMTYLALGDSYTIGESVAENDRWPVQLAQQLNKEGFNFASPQIIARTGWTTDELMEGIEKASTAGTFDLVSLLIGVNNQYRGRDTANFRVEFKLLMDLALEFAGDDTSRLLVLSIPDWGVTPFAEGRDRQEIAEEIDAYNQVVADVTGQQNILYVDVTAISRGADEDSSLLADDGLHPSGKMYGLWVDKVLPMVTDRLTNKKQ